MHSPKTAAYTARAILVCPELIPEVPMPSKFDNNPLPR
jgi:hypothetical protein